MTNDYVNAVANICAWWREALSSEIGMGVLPALEKIGESSAKIREKIGEESWDAIAKSIEDLVTYARDIDKPYWRTMTKPN
jgi:hypothetical protein